MKRVAQPTLPQPVASKWAASIAKPGKQPNSGYNLFALNQHISCHMLQPWVGHAQVYPKYLGMSTPECSHNECRTNSTFTPRSSPRSRMEMAANRALLGVPSSREVEFFTIGGTLKSLTRSIEPGLVNPCLLIGGCPGV